MLDLVLLRQQPQTATQIARRAQIQWALWYLGILGAAALMAGLMFRGTPSFSWPAWLVLFAGIALILYRPRYGIYQAVFWALAGDKTLMPWHPFIKNFSSRETLLYVSDAIIFSPLELFLIVTLLSWLLHNLMQRKLHFYRGPLFWPAILFGAFIGFGLVYGLTHGGDTTIALWETRAIFYMLLLMVLVGNLFNKRAHIEIVIWVSVVALFIKALYATYHLLIVLRGNLSNVPSLTDHHAAIHLATILVFLGAAWIFKVTWKKQLCLLMMLPPVLLTIIAAQRRAAFVALLIALVLLMIILFRERRAVFWVITPPVAVLGLLYMGAFWNSSHPLAGPAQAVKSVVAEDQADAQDRASNDYRRIENLNLIFTVRQRPLTGVGFGNKFYIIFPLPDISFFAWWEYIPHNTVIYIWIKAGIGAFLALLLFIGLSIAQGARAVIRVTDPLLRAVALTTTIFIVMHYVFAYVDMAWEPQGMVMLGIMLGIVNCVERIAAVDSLPAPRRWPWQPEPSPLAPLLSFAKD